MTEEELYFSREYLKETESVNKLFRMYLEQSRKRKISILLSNEGKEYLAEHFYRASGECICSTCGEKYMNHPPVINYPTFHYLCSGDFVKL